MKQKNLKKLPAKFKRYLIFGLWLGKQNKSTGITTETIDDLFHMNTTIEEQIAFYKKFHNDYKLFEKLISDKSKMKYKLQKNYDKSNDNVVCVISDESTEKNKGKNICDNTSETIEETIEENTDFLWEMDSEFDIILNEIV